MAYVEQIFPIAGEFVLGDNPRFDELAPSARGNHDRIADVRILRSPQRNRRQSQPVERLRETQAGFLVDRKRMGGNQSSAGGGQPNRLGFSDEVADRQNEAVIVDRDAAAGAFDAENRRREGVLGDLSLQRNDQTRGCAGPRRRDRRLRDVAAPPPPVSAFRPSALSVGELAMAPSYRGAASAAISLGSRLRLFRYCFLCYETPLIILATGLFLAKGNGRRRLFHLARPEAGSSFSLSRSFTRSNGRRLFQR